ncbi:hypothetical protein DPMN_186573 [Dreissena polymorpha]|uniref:Uncharacterized protein n=1 Tax=Dreissena polymorpha TaxID=45954 RepID=A0A9D4DNX8_DREPO|nr:hypothetical protein DPMN_186573 [Dreissena polymorpha]
MSQQQGAAAAALLRHAADLLNVNTSDRRTQYQHLHQYTLSLVTTNDHLLKELDRPGRDTSTDVNQINWSYKQLKRTFEKPV